MYTYRDILLYFPKYISLLSTKEYNLSDKEKIVFYGRLLTRPTLLSRSSIFFDFITDKKNVFRIISYNSYLKNILFLNKKYILTGTFYSYKKIVNLKKIFLFDEEKIKKPFPLYSLTSGLSQEYFRKIIAYVFSTKKIKNIIPDFFQKKYKLSNKSEILKKAHFPNNNNDILLVERYLKYEECLIFSVKNALSKFLLSKNNHKNIKKVISFLEIEKFVKKIGFFLTNSQQKAVKEILSDMNKNKIMLRLLQGDVGSGKTLVSIIALYGNFLRGEQGCLMAPTDALAQQHYETLKKIFKNTKIKIGLLVGKMTNKQKMTIKNDIFNKKIDILIGTHAVFSKIIEYNSLGLIVIDEQQRFGVDQRNQLIHKGNSADILLMSATPIPRTLALTIYGDIDITILKEFPFKEKKVITKIIKSNDDIIDRLIEKSIANKKQIYIIAPAIDSQNKDNVLDLFNKFLVKYPKKVTFLHGKMNYNDKVKSLKNFLSNKVPIMISTSIIEVGIDVPTANLMIIYDAINFGLSSLHQLRGRIGRNGEESFCLLVCDDENSKNERLKILENTNDGFLIAREDLRLRGSGELLGYKQSGLPEFRFVNIIDDEKIFEVSKKDAAFIINHIDMFKNEPILRIKK